MKENMTTLEKSREIDKKGQYFLRERIEEEERKEKQGIPNYDHDINYLMEEAETGVVILSCGCQIELDGTCEHGNESPLLTLGMI